MSCLQFRFTKGMLDALSCHSSFGAGAWLKRNTWAGVTGAVQLMFDEDSAQ